MYRVQEPINPDKLPSVIKSPQEAFEYVLAKAGANKGWSAFGTQNTRDAVEVVASVRDSAGQIIDGVEPGDPVCCVSQHYYAPGGWPEFKSGKPYADADKDGMEDHWEACAGVSDKNGHELDKDYTNLEVFLQETAGNQCYTKCAQTKCDLD
jgi:hypothetical protein